MEYQELQISGSRLKGQITPPSSLDETLTLMSLALMAPGQYRLTSNCEAGRLERFSRLLEKFGVEIGGTRRYFIDLASQQMHSANPDFIDSYQLPESLLVLVPAVLQFSEISLYLPELPEQPIWFYDQLEGILSSFGIRCTLRGGRLELKARYLKAATVNLPPSSYMLSVVALQAAVRAEGTSCLYNVVTGGEFIDICRALQKMGAMIEGVGTPQLRVQGINALAPQNLTAGLDNPQLLALFWATVLTKGTVDFTDLASENIRLLSQLSDKWGIAGVAEEHLFHLDESRVDLASTIFVESDYPQIDIPALLLLGAKQHQVFKIVSDQLMGFGKNLVVLERFGLRLVIEQGVLTCLSDRNLTATKMAAPWSLPALWLILGALAADGTSIIYNGAVVDRLFSHIDLQLARIEGKITRLVQG